MKELAHHEEIKDILDPRTLLLRKLPKKLRRPDILDLAGQFGTVRNVYVFYGWNQAKVEMETEEGARAFKTAADADELTLRGKTVEVHFHRAVTDEERVEYADDHPDRIEKEIAHCIKTLLDRVELKEVQRIALERRTNHKRLMKQVLAESKANGINEDICWEYVVSGGTCYRGEGCRFVHQMVPISDVPAKFRWFVEKDAFPNNRQISPDKAVVNNALVGLLGMVENPRCLILDGGQCNTVKALLQSKDHPRTPQDMVVPNICTDSYINIEKSGLSQAHHGSVRSYMDGHPNERFGIVYFDYCCRLSAGKFRVEKCPIADIKTLFEHQMLDATGCIFAVTLCKDEEERGDQPQKLRHLVTKCAAQNGRVAISHPERFSYLGTFTEIFWISDACHLDGYLEHKDIKAWEL